MGNHYKMIYQSFFRKEFLEDKKLKDILDHPFVEHLKTITYPDRFWLAFNAYDKHGDDIMMGFCETLDPYVLDNHNTGPFIAIIQDDYQECGDNFDADAKLVMKGMGFYTIAIDKKWKIKK